MNKKLAFFFIISLSLFVWIYFHTNTIEISIIAEEGHVDEEIIKNVPSISLKIVHPRLHLLKLVIKFIRSTNLHREVSSTFFRDYSKNFLLPENVLFLHKKLYQFHLQ